MEILGIGPLEAIFIVLLALIAIGPRDLGTAARSLGRTLNRMYRSEAWQSLSQASRNLRGLPNRLAREAALEELDQVRRELKDGPRPPSPPGSAPLEIGSDAGSTQPSAISPQLEGANSVGFVGPGDSSPFGGKPLPEKTRATKLASGEVSRRKASPSSKRSPAAGGRSVKTSAKKRPARSAARKKAARAPKRPRRSGSQSRPSLAPKRPRRSGSQSRPSLAPRRPRRSGSESRTARTPRRRPRPSARRGPGG